MGVIKEITTVASVSMPIGEHWTVKRCRYQSEEKAGPRLCIATGIHGDEQMGQLIVYDVARRIMAQPACLHGTVDVYPMLNAIGLDLERRMMPTGTQLDMNRAFPGNPDGTAMENICWHIVQDLKGADFVLDIHASSQITSEMYGVRLHERNADVTIPGAKALCPELIWKMDSRPMFDATLTGALAIEGTPAVVLEVDGRRLGVQGVADEIVCGIFCKMKEMGLWTGEAAAAPQDMPLVMGMEDVCRVTCTKPGMYVPREQLGETIKAGDVLGEIIDALHGEAVETVVSPVDGLIFTQRRYSAVYPGTLIARLCRKERA